MDFGSTWISIKIHKKQKTLYFLTATWFFASFVQCQKKKTKQEILSYPKNASRTCLCQRCRWYKVTQAAVLLPLANLTNAQRFRLRPCRRVFSKRMKNSSGCENRRWVRSSPALKHVALGSQSIGCTAPPPKFFLPLYFFFCVFWAKSSNKTVKLSFFYFFFFFFFNSQIPPSQEN